MNVDEPEPSTENLAAHRAQILASILPTAMMYGAMEVDPERDPLKVVQLISIYG
jgi:hypothetical protein